MNEWSHQEIKQIMETNEEVWLYLYTPMCGTCQVAGKMITIVAELFPNLQWGKCNLNYIPEYAANWEIESVPCLIVFKNHHIYDKLYAFHSVPFLYDKIKQIQAGSL